MWIKWKFLRYKKKKSKPHFVQLQAQLISMGQKHARCLVHLATKNTMIKNVKMTVCTNIVRDIKIFWFWLAHLHMDYKPNKISCTQYKLQLWHDRLWPSIHNCHLILQNSNIRTHISYVWQNSDNGMLQAWLLYFWTSSIITTEELQGLRFLQWWWWWWWWWRIRCSWIWRHVNRRIVASPSSLQKSCKVWGSYSGGGGEESGVPGYDAM